MIPLDAMTTAATIQGDHIIAVLLLVLSLLMTAILGVLIATYKDNVSFKKQITAVVSKLVDVVDVLSNYHEGNHPGQKVLKVKQMPDV